MKGFGYRGKRGVRMGKSKTERIDRLEKMLQGSNGEMHTYEPYQGVFADLEEHHSRLKAVEHDVPGLAGEIDLLLRRVIKLEQATDPKVKLNVESFPFIASTADVEDVPGAGEVTSETHLLAPEPSEDAQTRQRASSPPSTELSSGSRVRTPDGRTGSVIAHSDIPGGTWVELDQVSNVNRAELFKTEFLEVVR